MNVNHIESVTDLSISNKLKAYVALMKLRLSSLVVMSAFFGFLLADGNLLTEDFALLILGGILITGASNGFNQIIESKTDELMSRTQNRPLPTKILKSKKL